jgi:hypothetical protein
LRDFMPATVEQACDEWRNQPHGKQPKPGEIRAICQQIVERRNNALANKSEAWPDWLAELWGPRSTGEPARNAAIAAQEERWKRAAKLRLERHAQAMGEMPGYGEGE